MGLCAHHHDTEHPQSPGRSMWLKPAQTRCSFQSACCWLLSFYTLVLAQPVLPCHVALASSGRLYALLSQRRLFIPRDDLLVQPDI